MRNSLVGVLLVTISVLAGGAHAQLYRWTDAEGRTHYSNVAPPSEAKVIADRPTAPAANAPSTAPVRSAPADGARVPTPARTNATEPGTPAAPRPVATGGKQPRVVMYSTSWCPYCEKARAMFRARGIEYTEYDIEQSSQARAAHRELGGRGVPLILVGFEALRGFNEQRVLAAIEAQRGK